MVNSKPTGKKTQNIVDLTVFSHLLLVRDISILNKSDVFASLLFIFGHYTGIGMEASPKYAFFPKFGSKKGHSCKHIIFPQDIAI